MFRDELTQDFLTRYSLHIGQDIVVASFIEIMRKHLSELEEGVDLRQVILEEFEKKTCISSSNFHIFTGILENLRISSFNVFDIQTKGAHMIKHASLVGQINRFLFPSCEGAEASKEKGCHNCGGSACGNYPGER